MWDITETHRSTDMWSSRACMLIGGFREIVSMMTGVVDTSSPQRFRGVRVTTLYSCKLRPPYTALQYTLYLYEVCHVACR